MKLLLFLCSFVVGLQTAAIDTGNKLNPPNFDLKTAAQNALESDLKKNATKICQTTFGPIKGSLAESKGVTAELYNSVPYAKPPIKDLRFEYPTRPTPWKTPLDTIKFNQCVQTGLPGLPGMEEDCLTFKIIIPVDGNGQRYKEKLPAVFWINGASYLIGSKESFKTRFVIDHFSSQKIIFIAPNYRLGALGFLKSWTKNDTQIPGNYGLEDIILALNVVRENAEHFGIDVDRITLAGNSAGATAAGILAVSPRTKGLFSSLILLSASSQTNYAVRNEATTDNSHRYVEACKCSRSSTAEIKKCMKEVNYNCIEAEFHKIAAEYNESYYEPLTMNFAHMAPVIDVQRGKDSIIPEEMDGYSEKAARVPLLISVVSDQKYHFGSQLLAQRFTYEKMNNGTSDLGNLFAQGVKSLLSYYRGSRAAVNEAVRARYDLNNKKTWESYIETVCDLVTDESLSFMYEEALAYAERDQKVYVVQNRIFENIRTPEGINLPVRTTEGMDMLLTFTEEALTLCRSPPDCVSQTANNWKKLYAGILGEFIKTKSVSKLEPFTQIHRNAYELSNNGTRSIDFHTDDYFFWIHTIPVIEALNIGEVPKKR